MERGGKRPGAGRPAGARNKKTAELIEAIEDSGETPLEYLISVVRDTKEDARVRLDAAKAAAPYVHCRMPSQTEISGPDGKEFEINLVSFLDVTAKQLET